MGSSQQFSLRWNNYLKHITSAFETLRTDEDLVDVTLSCEGKRIRAHKMLLSACSTYFRDLFKENPCQHPVIIFRNVKFDDLAALVDFIYQGEVNVVQEQLDSFMTTAELLAVQGLTDGTRKDDNIVDEDIEIPNEPEVQLRNVSGKVITNHKNNRSPILHSPFHAVDLQHETPPVKRRRYRESANVNFVDKSHRNALSPKESDSIKQDCQAMSDPVEIIPIMPNMKLEMPEYVEQDGSSCSYEEQNASENSNKLNLDESHIDTGDHENKPDISQTFYTNQATKLLEPADQSADIGYLISKPGTSGERMTQETTQELSSSLILDDLNNDEAAAAAGGGIGAGNGNQGLLGTLIRRRSRPIHDENGRWVCDVCGKVYNRGDSLAHHRSIHRGDTVCPICQAVFTRKYTMRCHMVNVHGVKIRA